MLKNHTKCGKFMPPVFDRWFLTNLFGYPFHERINMLRIAKAKEYLSDKRYKSLPLSMIEHALGFNSRINFYRVFKESTGLSPEEYRDRA